MFTSFYSERTAEYALVPAFLKILDSLGDSAPLYFWKTREGNNTAEMLHYLEYVRVVAFFARRPKINPRNTKILEMKINSSLYKFSQEADKFHIPVFCGLPLTTNIFGLNNPQCLWFHVEPSYYGIEPIIHIKNEKCQEDNQLSSLSQQEVLEIIKEKSKYMPWSYAVEVMNELYRRPSDGRPFLWWVRNWHYKPMYYIIKSSNNAKGSKRGQ